MCACTTEQPRRLIVSNPFATLLCWISVSRFPWSVPMICSDRPTVRTNKPTYERTVCVLFHFLTHFHRQFSFRICSRVMYVFARRLDVYRRTSYEFNKNLKWKSKEKTSKWRAREPTFYFPSYLVLLSLFNRSTNTHTCTSTVSAAVVHESRKTHIIHKYYVRNKKWIVANAVMLMLLLILLTNMRFNMYIRWKCSHFSLLLS